MGEIVLVDADTLDILADGGKRMAAILRGVAGQVCSGPQEAQEVRGELAVWVLEQPDRVAALEDRKELFRQARSIRDKQRRQNPHGKKVKTPRRASHLRAPVTVEKGEMIVGDARTVQPAEVAEVRLDTGDLTGMVRAALPDGLRPVFEADLRLQAGGELASAKELAAVLTESGRPTTEKAVRQARTRIRQKALGVLSGIVERRRHLFEDRPSPEAAAAYLAAASAFRDARPDARSAAYELGWVSCTLLTSTVSRPDPDRAELAREYAISARRRLTDDADAPARVMTARSDAQSQMALAHSKAASWASVLDGCVSSGDSLEDAHRVPYLLDLAFLLSCYRHPDLMLRLLQHVAGTTGLTVDDIKELWANTRGPRFALR